MAAGVGERAASTAPRLCFVLCAHPQKPNAMKAAIHVLSVSLLAALAAAQDIHVNMNCKIEPVGCFTDFTDGKHVNCATTMATHHGKSIYR